MYCIGRFIQYVAVASTGKVTSSALSKQSRRGGKRRCLDLGKPRYAHDRRKRQRVYKRPELFLEKKSVSSVVCENSVPGFGKGPRPYLPPRADGVPPRGCDFVFDFPRAHAL